ncbi:MAG: xanthine dehydrogenase family protein subunit M [Pseudomonadota bacterium]
MFIRRLPAFEYHTPSSVGEALDLMEKHGNEGRYIAGGTDLLIAMKKREAVPDHLIALTGVASLKGIVPDDKGVRIGALTTLAEIERSEIIGKQYLPLRDAVRVMASIQVRNLATIGGNLCSAVPSADSAPPLMALDASVKLVGPEGERTVPLETFFTGPKRSILKNREILTEISIPKPDPASSGCYLKLMRRHAMDLALVGVAACLKLDSDRKVCKEARITLGAVAPTPIRVPEVEAGLVNREINETVAEEAAQIAGMECRPITDLRASLDYRCSAVAVLTKRAVLETLKRITG